MPSLLVSLALCLAGFSLFRGIHSEYTGPMSQCTTPGFYLSSDENWCFGFIMSFSTVPIQSVHCKLNGATLVTIENSNKRLLIGNYISQGGISETNYLIMGLTNIIGAQTDWAWYQGNGTVDWTDWGTSYPDTATTRANCAMFIGGFPDYSWKNDYCLRTYQAICQREATSDDLM